MQALDRNTCKAARALVDWTASELGEKSAVPIDTIRSFESGRTKMLSRDNERSIRKALEAGGVQFLDTGQVSTGIGVVLVVSDDTA